MRLALIGVGRWGTNIKRTLESMRGVEVVTLEKGDDIDPTSPKLRGAGGVLIATPGSTHAQIALPFIKKGLPVFIEKPMTTSLQDAKKLEAVAKKSGSIVMVGHIHLYNPAFLKAKELSKKAGRLNSLYFEGMNNGPYRDDMSALWDWSPHDVSMALDLVSKKPTHVQAWGNKVLRPKTDLYDSGQIKLYFPGNLIAIIQFCWMSPYKIKLAVISGSKDTIIFDDTEKKKVELQKNFGPSVRGQIIKAHQPKISYPAYGKMSPLEVELRAFVQAIKTGKQPLTDIQHAVDVISVLDAAERSMKLDGKRVVLE